MHLFISSFGCQHFQDKEASLPRSFQRQRIEGLFYTELNEISKMLHSHRPKEPYFVFPDIGAYKELSFKKLTSENSVQLYLLFESDENPFTDAQFKQYESAKEYTEQLEQYGAFSPKHGGQDWLFLWNNEYAGILHLYDLSLETFAENNRRCWVGFATKPELRNKGITKKVLQYFLQYIFSQAHLFRTPLKLYFKTIPIELKLLLPLHHIKAVLPLNIMLTYIFGMLPVKLVNAHQTQ